MNCEMAQRIIALAALAPAHTRHATSNSRDQEPAETYTANAVPWQTGAAGNDRPAPEDDSGPRTHGGVATSPEGASFSSAAALDQAFDLVAYGEAEVAESDLLALEEHLSGCRACQAEMASTAAFYRALSLTRELTRQAEPTPSLLARARMRLDATLDNNAHESALAHLLQQLSFSAGRLRAAPGLASGLLLLGLVAGGYAGYHAGQQAHNSGEQAQLLLEPAASRPPMIADISSIVRDPDSEWVEVHYNRLVPDAFSGSLDDPAVRRLLMLAMKGANPSVSSVSIGLLASECRHGHACNGGPIRSALLSALHGDRKPQVRIEALDGLEPYIAEDVQVRDAVVRAMLADASADVRIEAIRLLAPVEVDSSVRQALYTVASRDGDPIIRNASQQMLNGMPQLQ